MLVGFLRISQRILVHLNLQEIIIPEALNQIKLELEHTHSRVDLLPLVQPLPGVILPNLAHLPEQPLQEPQTAIEGDQLQCPIRRVYNWCDLHVLAALGLAGEDVVQVLALLLGAVSLVVDLVPAGRGLRAGWGICGEGVQLREVLFLFVVFLAQHLGC